MSVPWENLAPEQHWLIGCLTEWYSIFRHVMEDDSITDEQKLHRLRVLHDLIEFAMDDEVEIPAGQVS